MTSSALARVGASFWRNSRIASHQPSISDRRAQRGGCFVYSPPFQAGIIAIASLITRLRHTRLRLKSGRQARQRHERIHEVRDVAHPTAKCACSPWMFP